MTKSISCLLLLVSSLFMATTTYAQSIQTITLDTGFKNQQRTLLISLPDGYESNESTFYEVIYVFDSQGQEYFDMVHSSVDFLQPAGCGYIVVGVPSPYYNEDYHRFHDFLPESRHAATKTKYGTGNVEAFLNFVENTVFPAIESMYRTAPNRIGVGHSNGGTFLTYTLTTRPALFDAIIGISPNYSFDEGQITDRVKAFNPSIIQAPKFIFLSSGIEDASNGWRAWEVNRQQVYAELRSSKWSKYVYFETARFPTETHQSTYPIGIVTGFSAYFKYQYKNFENLVTHLNKLKNRNVKSIDAQKLNLFAYNLNLAGDTQGALQLLQWSNQLFPQDLKTYESLGDLHKFLKDHTKAADFYNLFSSKLESQKETLPEEEYNKYKETITSKMNTLGL